VKLTRSVAVEPRVSSLHRDNNHRLDISLVMLYYKYTPASMYQYGSPTVAKACGLPCQLLALHWMLDKLTSWFTDMTKL